MKKTSGFFWFGVALTLSILAVVYCFEYADATRGYNSTGGEVFTIALPLIPVWNKLKTMGGQIERLKQQNSAKRQNNMKQKHIQ